MTCTRNYTAHVCGIELSVRGLAFQQQDVGVSACATTALWSSFHKMRSFEDIGRATPVQITMMASSNTLPFGRSMPSEGLSIDQMCLAVQSVGLSPNLYKTKNFGLDEIAIALIHDVNKDFNIFGGDRNNPSLAVSFEYWIQFGHTYIQNLFLEEKRLPAGIREVGQLALPRYIGVIRLRAPYLDPIDVLVDTTSTKRNPFFVGLLVKDYAKSHTKLISQKLAKTCGCPLV